MTTTTLDGQAARAGAIARVLAAEILLIRAVGDALPKPRRGGESTPVAAPVREVEA